MAKKQKIILLHGDYQLTGNTKDNAKILTNGEVAIYNASDAKNVELYATTSGESLATFATKEYYTPIIEGINTTLSGHTEAIEDLQGSLGENNDTTGSTAWANINQLNDEVSGLKELLGNGDGDKNISERVSALESSLGENIDTTGSTAWANINRLNTTVGNADNGLVKDVNDLGASIEDLNETIDGLNFNTNSTSTKYVYSITQSSGMVSALTADLTSDAVAMDKGTDEYKDADNVTKYINIHTAKLANIEGNITGITENIDDIEGNITAISGNVTTINSALNGYLEANAVSNGIAAAKTEVKGEDTTDDGTPYISVTSETGTNGNNVYNVVIKNAASKNSLEDVSEKVATLIGEDGDKNKSVREIANDELAKQLIASGASEALDTLEEIARWIQEHPEDAAAMNASITELQKITSGYASTGATRNSILSDISALENRVDDIEENAVYTITVKNADNHKISATKNDNSYEFNFDDMVIDGGTY